MERIQSAIAKARAERSAGQADTGLTATGGVAAPVSAPLPGTAQSAAAWAALSPYEADAAQLRQRRIVSVHGGHDASSFDVMRTRVLQQIRANSWRRIAVTSPTPGCGKSTIALNLAFSLSRQPELRTILAELDLRRPSLAGMLGIRGRASFASVLEGKSDFGDCALRHDIGLAIAVNDKSVRNPAELIHSSQVPGALRDIEARYEPDLMIFDLPPILVSDDAMAFVGQVDAVLLIAAAEETRIAEVDTCERELAEQTNVMGVVLNKCRYMGPGYGYSYYD